MSKEARKRMVWKGRRMTNKTHKLKFNLLQKRGMQRGKKEHLFIVYSASSLFPMASSPISY
jgi:hypothetical protein